MRTGLTDLVSVSALDLAEMETCCHMSVQCREAVDATLQAAGAETLDQLDRLALRNLQWHLRTMWAATWTSDSGPDLDTSQHRGIGGKRRSR